MDVKENPSAMKKKNGYDYYTNRHSCFLLQYHIVLVTKYRHPVLTGDVKAAVYERINYVAENRGFNILELNGEADHVHLLIDDKNSRYLESL